MRQNLKKIPYVAIAVLAALAGLMALGAGKTPGGAASAYDVTVDTIEGCSCPLFCGCYFNGEPNDPHMCEFNNVYKFKPGSHYGGVDLSNAIVWMSGDLGGEWGKKDGMPTEWVVNTFDKKTTQAQRDAIMKVEGVVFPVKWKSATMREDDITWRDDATTAEASMASGMARIELAKVMGPAKQKPTVVENLGYWGAASNEGFELAHSTHTFTGEKKKFAHKHANGFTITWRAKGEIKPEPAKSATGG